MSFHLLHSEVKHSYSLTFMKPHVVWGRFHRNANTIFYFFNGRLCTIKLWLFGKSEIVAECTQLFRFWLLLQVNIDFDNWLSLATTTSNTGSILLDGYPVDSNLWQKIGDYSVATQQISPGFHAVTTDPKSSATFGGWLYGHSLDPYSPSAYGYPIGYKSK